MKWGAGEGAWRREQRKWERSSVPVQGRGRGGGVSDCSTTTRKVWPGDEGS